VLPAVEAAPVEVAPVDALPLAAPLLDDVVVVPVVELDVDVLLGVVTVALPVVGTVSGGAPVVFVRLPLLPPPQAAKTRPAANAAISANVLERVGMEQ
jgi:hypothetical protein